MLRTALLAACPLEAEASSSGTLKYISLRRGEAMVLAWMADQLMGSAGLDGVSHSKTIDDANSRFSWSARVPSSLRSRVIGG